MADSVSLIYRQIVIEDLYPSVTLAQTTGPVLNVGSDVPITPFLSLANDQLAINEGANPGDVYINTTNVPNRLRAIPGYSASITISTVTLANLSFQSLGTFTVNGAQVGYFVQIAVLSPLLAPGVFLTGQAIGVNTVQLSIYNMSGGTYNGPITTLNVIVTAP